MSFRLHLGVTQPAKISRTSIYVAAGRAVGAREPDPSAKNPDYLAEKLLGDPSKLELDHPAVRALSLSYDEAMRDVEVILGAGFDTTAPSTFFILEDSAKRYLTRADGTQVGAQAIAEAMARMAARAREAAPTPPEVQQQMSPGADAGTTAAQRVPPGRSGRRELDTKADAPESQLWTQSFGFPVPSSVPLMYQFFPSGSWSIVVTKSKGAWNSM